MPVGMDFVGAYCEDVFQGTVENCAEELVFWQQGEKLSRIAVKEQACLPFPGKSGP